jgi:hypothetical protein
MLALRGERTTKLAGLQRSVPAPIEFGSSRRPKTFLHDAIDLTVARRRPR